MLGLFDTTPGSLTWPSARQHCLAQWRVCHLDFGTCEKVYLWTMAAAAYCHSLSSSPQHPFPPHGSGAGKSDTGSRAKTEAWAGPSCLLKAPGDNALRTPCLFQKLPEATHLLQHRSQGRCIDRTPCHDRGSLVGPPLLPPPSASSTLRLRWAREVIQDNPPPRPPVSRFLL